VNQQSVRLAEQSSIWNAQQKVHVLVPEGAEQREKSVKPLPAVKPLHRYKAFFLGMQDAEKRGLDH
jgi:hypothetical protein